MIAYHQDLIAKYPTIRAGLLRVNGLRNGPSSPQLLQQYAAVQQEVLATLAKTPIAERPSISAWRRAFTAFGVKPTQYRVAAEALLRRLQKHGDIPSINALVDMGNLVSIKFALPVAVFDQAAVTGNTTVRLADGTEQFTEFGAEQPIAPEAGEVVFVDDADVVSARRWCWRQGAQSAVTVDSEDVLVHRRGPS